MTCKQCNDHYNYEEDDVPLCVQLLFVLLLIYLLAIFEAIIDVLEN